MEIADGRNPEAPVTMTGSGVRMGVADDKCLTRLLSPCQGVPGSPALRTSREQATVTRRSLYLSPPSCPHHIMLFFWCQSP